MAICTAAKWSATMGVTTASFALCTAIHNGQCASSASACGPKCPCATAAVERTTSARIVRPINTRRVWGRFIIGHS